MACLEKIRHCDNRSLPLSAGRRIRVWVLLAAAISVPVQAAAQNTTDDELERLLDMDIASLTQVSVASRRLESSRNAPGILSVITAEEIRRYGARNLRDVLDRQSSLLVFGSNTFPHGRVSLRGASFVHNDVTVLLLLNGRSMLEGTGGSTNHDIYANFPLDSIKQIEIIRGPGSVLYGTNALAGVINIVTHDADASHTELSLTYGSHDSSRAEISGGVNWNDIELYGAISVRDSEGEDFRPIVDQFGSTGSYQSGGDAVSGVLKLGYKNVTLNAYSNDSASDNANVFFTLPGRDLDIRRRFIALGYEQEITANWNISANLSYHYQLNELSSSSFGDHIELVSENTTIDISSRGSLTENLSLLLGASAREENGFLSTNDRSWNSNTFSGFAQFDYWLSKNWLLIGGLQYNKPKVLSGNLSLRAGSIYHINDNWGVKLLWAEAFREPNAFERFLTLPNFITGDPQLEPEMMKTLDLQLFYESQQGSFATTLYHSEQDRISRVGMAPQRIVNAGIVDYYGLELEGKWSINNRLSIIANASYQYTKDDAGRSGVVYAPDLMLKAGVHYDSNSGYQIGIFNSYFAESALQNSDLTTVTRFNSEADGYNLLTLNLNLDLERLLGNSAFRSLSLSVYADNLLDEDIYYPNSNTIQVNSVPHHQGRSLYATLRVKF